MQTSTVCPSPVDVLSAELLPKTTLDSQQVYPPMLARACLQNSCWGSQQEIDISKTQLQSMFLTATSNPEDIPKDKSVQLPSTDSTSDYVHKTFVCPSSVDVSEEDVISYAEYLYSNINEELIHHMEALDKVDCSQLDQDDATAQVCDSKSLGAHVLTYQMSEIIPKPARTFILAPNGIVKPSRIPIVTYQPTYVSPSLPDSCTDVCLQHSCWESPQNQVPSPIEQKSIPEDISPADNALIPLAMELDTLMHYYGEPIDDVIEIVFESTKDCAVSPLDLISEEPEACHIASTIPETCKCAQLDHLSKTIIYIDGETTLDTLAMELDSLLYSVHGVYALDEVTIELDPIFASVDNKIFDNASLDILAFELDSMFDILVFEADLPAELGNQTSLEHISDSGCVTSNALPTSLPTASEAPSIEVPSPIDKEVKPKPPPRPNIVILGTPGWSEVVKELQMSFPMSRKISNFDKDNLILSSNTNAPREACIDSQLLQKHHMKKQYLPPEGKQKVNQLMHGFHPCETNHKIGKPEQPTAPPYCHTSFWHQGASFLDKRAPFYAHKDRPSYSNCHRHSIYKPWGEKKVFTAHIGWENGESSIIKFLDDSYKLPP